MSSNVIYLGHIPNGFVEKDMWEYFSQFGHLKKLKLFRSKKTGNSKGFAFLQFVDEDVAKIVASTMNNYLMFDKLLKCHVVPKEKIHPNMFKNWRAVPLPKLLAERNAAKQNSLKTDKQIIRMRQRLAEQIKRQNKKIAAAGIDYSFPVTWIDVKTEIKEEVDDEPAAETSKEIGSEYSMIVDSSDEEIVLKTPENVVKRHKNEKKKKEKSSKKKKTKTTTSKAKKQKQRYFK